jgi:hypothetical protein
MMAMRYVGADRALREQAQCLRGANQCQQERQSACVCSLTSAFANPALRPKSVDKANGAMALLENLQLIRQWGEDQNNDIEFSVSPAATNPRLMLSKAGAVIIGVQADGGVYL